MSTQTSGIWMNKSVEELSDKDLDLAIEWAQEEVRQKKQTVKFLKEHRKLRRYWIKFGKNV